MKPNDFMNGHCDSFALALIEDHPHLKLAVVGQSTDDGWWPTHYLAHDEKCAYDATGRHALAELGAIFGLDVIELDQPLEDWFGSEAEPENGDCRSQARHLMKTMPWITALSSPIG